MDDFEQMTIWDTPESKENSKEITSIQPSSPNLTENQEQMTIMPPVNVHKSENIEKFAESNLITRTSKIINPDIVNGLQKAINLLIERGRDDNFTEETVELALRELYGENKISDKYYFGEGTWETTLPDIIFVEKKPNESTYRLLKKEYEEFQSYYSTHKFPREKSEPRPGSVEIKSEDRGLYLFLQKIIKKSGEKYYNIDDLDESDNRKYYITEYGYISRILENLNLDQRTKKWVAREIILVAMRKGILTERTNFKSNIKTYFFEENDLLIEDEEKGNEAEINNFIYSLPSYLKNERRK